MSRAYRPRLRAGWYRVPPLHNGAGVALFLRVVNVWKGEDAHWYVQYLTPITEENTSWCWENDRVHQFTRYFRRVPPSKVLVEVRQSVAPHVKEWSKEGIRQARRRRGLL